MKALVLAAALAALISATPAGAARDVKPEAISDAANATLVADAGNLGHGKLAALNAGSHWAPGPADTAAATDFAGGATPIDRGTLLIAAVAAALALSRPLRRFLRRQEQQRRAAALASTLGQAPRG